MLPLDEIVVRCASAFAQPATRTSATPIGMKALLIILQSSTQYICHASRPADLTTRQPVARQKKPVKDSQHETSELMMPGDANNMGHVFGGVIMSMMDKCAAISAFRHCRAPVVTASIDRVDFREPIHLGDLVVMKSSVNYVGKSSMEVGVRVEAEDLMTGRRRHTNSCYLTFVAVDRNGRPIEVPELLPETPDEKRRHQAATERRARRVEERKREEATK